MLSMEGHVFLDRWHIDFRHEDGFAEAALALAILVLEKVALALTATQHFTGTSDLKALGDCFSGFG
jgi:hypothetical protein